MGGISIGCAAVAGGAENIFGSTYKQRTTEFVDPKPIDLCKEFTELMS